MILKDALIASLKRRQRAVVQLLEGTLEEPKKLIVWDLIKYPWEKEPWFATNVGAFSERWMREDEFKNEDGSFKDNFYPVPAEYNNWVADHANSMKIKEDEDKS